MDIRLTVFKEDAAKLKDEFGPSIRVKKMRGTDRKVLVYLNNAGPSCVFRMGEILTGITSK